MFKSLEKSGEKKKCAEVKPGNEESIKILEGKKHISVDTTPKVTTPKVEL
jgi:hypothetical protein